MKASSHQPADGSTEGVGVTRTRVTSGRNRKVRDPGPRRGAAATQRCSIDGPASTAERAYRPSTTSTHGPGSANPSIAHSAWGSTSTRSETPVSRSPRCSLAVRLAERSRARERGHAQRRGSEQGPRARTVTRLPEGRDDLLGEQPDLGHDVVVGHAREEQPADEMVDAELVAEAPDALDAGLG